MTHIEGGRPGYNFADRVGAVFQFPDDVTIVRSKVGISWISSAKAQAMLQEEIPAFDLDGSIAAVKVSARATVQVD